MAVSDGGMICVPWHDALLLEALLAEIEAQAQGLAQIMGLIGSFRRTLAVTELQARLSALEGR